MNEWISSKPIFKKARLTLAEDAGHILVNIIATLDSNETSDFVKEFIDGWNGY